MTKQHLWQAVYIEAMRQSRINDPKELADKAVKDYEDRFEQDRIDVDWSVPGMIESVYPEVKPEDLRTKKK